MMATGAVTPTAGAVATPVNSNPDLAITHNVSFFSLVHFKRKTKLRIRWGSLARNDRLVLL